MNSELFEDLGKSILKGGVKSQRPADQNCDTPDLFTPPETGCQLVSIHIFYTSPEPVFSESGESSSSFLASRLWSRRLD